MRQSGWQRAVKVMMDRSGAALLIIVTLPITLTVAVLVAIFLGRPVLFRQRRPGLHGRIFTLFKFRTMTDDRDAEGHLLPDESRLTAFGRFLRRSSLDELPQLWNVVRGELSFVGPRPLLVQYLERYSSEERRRHDVLPGLTGWAQINGRNAISWQEKFALDLWYVDNWSLGLDLRILFGTLVHVLRREGINASGSATMPEFLGSNDERESR
jgi:sugar transferase EpsL